MTCYTSVLTENGLTFKEEEIQKLWEEQSKYADPVDADIDIIVTKQNGQLTLLAVYEAYMGRYELYIEGMEHWSHKLRLNFDYYSGYEEFNPCPAGTICSTCQTEIQEMYEDHPCEAHFCQCNRNYTD